MAQYVHHRQDRSWYLAPDKPACRLSLLQIEASATRLSSPDRYRVHRSSGLFPDASRASSPGSKASIATTGMREVGIDGSFYTRVGTQWVKQLVVTPQELAVIVARLNSQPVKEVETNSISSHAKAVKLTYQKNATSGFNEVYLPVKRVNMEEQKQSLCALADRCQESRKETKAHLRQKYLQPVAKTKVYSKEEGKEQAARIQRLVEGLGAYEKPQ